MKCLDDFCLWAKNKSDFIEKKYFFFLGKEEMNTPEGFNKNMKKIKNLLFKIDEKEQIAKEKFEILKKEVKGCFFFEKIR